MTLYRVVQVYEVEAPGREEALELADTAPLLSEYARPKELPAERGYPSELYEQPLDVLDLAWDDYMDRTLPQDLNNSVRVQLPSLVDLGCARIDPPTLSLLFDLAITAYRRSVEP
jgi:hypothetical protein